MALTPDLKVDLKTDPEQRKRRKQSAQELSSTIKNIVGGQGMQLGQMSGSQAPDALGMLSSSISAFKMLGKLFASDKKLKKNIKTISNFKEILYG